jgi:hypothetical protein
LSLEKANLMKLTTTNSAGSAISLRDMATFIAVEPELTIAKSNNAVAPVTGADTVDYTVNVASVADAGPGSPSDEYARAEDTVVTDDLPAPITCADVTLDVIAGVTGTCVGSQIEWTIAVLDAADSIDLTYTVNVPDTVAPGQTYTNTATITTFDQTNNDGGTTTYTPGTTDNSQISTPDSVLVKLQQSSISEAGNIQNASLLATADEATIGELVAYQLSVDIPAGVTLYDANYRDLLPANMTIVGGVTGTYDDDISGGAAASAMPIVGFSFNWPSPAATLPPRSRPAWPCCCWVPGWCCSLVAVARHRWSISVKDFDGTQFAIASFVDGDDVALCVCDGELSRAGGRAKRATGSHLTGNDLIDLQRRHVT